MARKDKPKGKDREFRSRARRDVRVAFRPQFQALGRSERAGERDAAQYQDQIQRIYASLQGSLEGLGPAYQAQVGAIQAGLQQALQGLQGGMLSPTASEQTAASVAFGSLGAGSLGQLASAGQRGAGYNTSALRQTAIDQANYQTSVLQDLDNFKKSLSEQRQDLSSQMAPLILSRIDELKDRAAQLRLANREFQLRKLATMSDIGMQEGAQQGWQTFFENTPRGRPPRRGRRPPSRTPPRESTGTRGGLAR
jgi:hypothetical protein